MILSFKGFVAISAPIAGIILLYTIVTTQRKFTMQENRSKITKYKTFKCFKWVMLCGDSNMRNIYFDLIKNLDRKITNKYGSIRYVIKSHLNSDGDSRWFDRDKIFYIKDGRCIRASFRFINEAVTQLRRVNNTWSTIRHINDFPTVQAEQFRQSGHPDLFYFTHGLWGIHKISEKTSCNESFQLISEILKSFSITMKVIWQSNPSISYYAKMSNEQLVWDVKCQMRFARNKNIPMFNLFKYINDDKEDRIINQDIHIAKTTSKYVVNMIWQEMYRKSTLKANKYLYL